MRRLSGLTEIEEPSAAAEKAERAAWVAIDEVVTYPRPRPAANRWIEALRRAPALRVASERVLPDGSRLQILRRLDGK